MPTYFLYECSLGYALFEIDGYEEISQNVNEFRASMEDFKKVSKIIKKVNFLPFKTSEEALDNTKAVNNNTISNELKAFLKENIPSKKNKDYTLLCVEKSLAQKITEELNLNVQVGEFIIELSRVVRTFQDKYLKISDHDIVKSQLGLGHSYSRMKCMFDVNRQDKPIIQAIALIDILDKDINNFSMRVKEWFGWHFPELAKIVKDNYLYIRLVKVIKERKNLIENKDELKTQIDDITMDPEMTKQIFDSAVMSMGSEISEGDLLNIKLFTAKVESLVRYRENLANYLKEKMKKLAPNTSALVGEVVAARLVSHSGSLSSLAKYPASTIQILGAEKALFRALKTRSKTPKYGLLYNSSFIGKAKAKNKGKISRYLANKLAMCARIDYFSNDRFDEYGNELKKQIEERQVYLDSGAKPRKNIDVMKVVSEKIERGLKAKKEVDKEKEESDKEEDDVKDKKLLNKKRKKSESSEDDEESVEIVKVSKKKKKVVKKKEESSDDE